MKWVGILLVFVSCTLYGFLMDLWQKKRIKELDKFIQAFELLKGEIEYRLTPMAEALSYVASFTTGGVEKVLKDYSCELQEKNTAEASKMWRQALDSNKPYFHLQSQDYQLLYEFADLSGNMDKSMQSKSMTRMIEKLQKVYTQSKEKYDRTNLLNKYLGVLVGICLCIFLI